ncbi:hypothetical protein FE840_009745 [Peteryoungia desertarenae]|uniref:Uncharacterized protein n=1 Tax=Peteryoungia desertarenae TaxID=1813451 RepID=A0ABX6QMP1_9HYPH|nr:hypothetical protein [Peteryoungia desertarenae]QLF69800.1 hypothetical protein FE840_009745 [Peteryoungia desertarenae]
MADADGKHMGRGSQGKGDGSGAMTDIQKDMLPENEVLSNRDKSQHPKSRGLDSKHVQNEQYQDNVDNRLERE